MQGLFASSAGGDTPKRLFETPRGDASEDSADEPANVQTENDLDDSAVLVAKDTPKMDALFGGSSDVVIGYFGELRFIDRQEDFDSTFGMDPAILPSLPTSSDNTTTAKILLDFSD